jgi:hypothetical protein
MQSDRGFEHTFLQYKDNRMNFTAGEFEQNTGEHLTG